MTVTHVETPPLTNDAVRLFADLARDDVDYAGGKGANLGELHFRGTARARRLRRRRPRIRCVLRADRLAREIDGPAGRRER